ncbi:MULTISPECIES: hypothetical protein [unclassified Anabaena]|uniref:hypothetical protein n=1 Tax=unclassified Anabaena TaxID=2619674 RepID=UPI00082DF821|nr:MULTISPECIES: hypothetical protein [unclassified Anabaena]
MQAIAKNNLFTEISAEDAAEVYGGGLRGLLIASAYFNVIQALTGNPAGDLERNIGLLLLMGALSVPGSLFSIIE